MSKIKIKIKKPNVELKPIKDIPLIDRGKSIVGNVSEGGKEAISAVADKVTQVGDTAKAKAELQQKKKEKKEIIKDIEAFADELKDIMDDKKDLCHEYANYAYSIIHLRAKYIK